MLIVSALRMQRSNFRSCSISFLPFIISLSQFWSWLFPDKRYSMCRSTHWKLQMPRRSLVVGIELRFSQHQKHSSASVSKKWRCKERNWNAFSGIRPPIMDLQNGTCSRSEIHPPQDWGQPVYAEADIPYALQTPGLSMVDCGFKGDLYMAFSFVF